MRKSPASCPHINGNRAGDPHWCGIIHGKKEDDPSMRPEHNPDYQPHIDGLRAIAVLAVLIFHAFPTLAPGGFVGVDVFFVISGYLIGKIILSGLRAGTFAFGGFYARRIRRIFPSLLVVLACCYVFGWFSLLPGEFKELGKHLLAGAAFVSNLALWSEAGYFDASAELKPLLHLWSLGIEEQFYIAWPLILWVATRLRISAMLPITLLACASFALNVVTLQSHPTAVFYSPLSRVWELLVGTLLAYQHLHGRSLVPNARNAKSALGAALIVIPIFGLTSSLPFPGWWALLPTIGTYLVIDAGMAAALNRNVMSARSLVWVGIISYPLYLWHWPLISFENILMRGAPSAWMRAAAVGASIALAWLTYRFVERPIRYGSWPSLKVAALCGTSTAVALLGGVSIALDGVPSRYPAEMWHIANFKYEFYTDARYKACWLSVEQPPDGFDKHCIAEPTKSGEREIVVWGDSHAARLYPGLHTRLGNTAAITQFTRDGCAPILGYGYANCQRSNDFVIAEIEHIKPQTVILFAAWWQYLPAWENVSPNKNGLLASIARLKRAGVSDIVIIGPAPRWSPDLPKLVYERWRDSYPFHRIPARLETGHDGEIASLDSDLSALLRAQATHYVSLQGMMCATGGCLTHVPDQPADLMTWDYGHLTTPAAVFVSKYLSDSGVL